MKRRARMETGRGRGTAHAQPQRKRKPARKDPKPGTVRVVLYLDSKPADAELDGGENVKADRNPLRGRPPAG